MNLDFAFLSWPVISSFILKGFLFSVQLTLIAMIGGIALGTLAFTHRRFRFAHPVADGWWSRVRRPLGGRAPRSADAHAPTPVGAGAVLVSLATS